MNPSEPKAGSAERATSSGLVHFKACGDAPNLCGKPGYDGGFFTPRRDRSTEAKVTCPDCRSALSHPSASPMGQGDGLDLDEIRRKALSRADGYGILNEDVFDVIQAAPKMADEIERLNRVIVDQDRARDFRSTPVYEKMIGGSDVCATCEAHCVVAEEDAETERLRGSSEAREGAANHGFEPGVTVCGCSGYSVPHEYGANECRTYWAVPKRDPITPAPAPTTGDET